MILKVRFFPLGITTLLLSICSIGESISQVLPSREIKKILKEIYDRPVPDKFALGGFEWDYDGKKIMVFGTKHNVRNAADTLFSKMEKDYARISPNMVFVEGITAYLNPVRNINIERGGDMAFARYLAYKGGQESYVWDSYGGEMYNLLRKNFSRDDIFLFLQMVKLRGRSFSGGVSTDLVLNNTSREWSALGVPFTSKEWNPEHFQVLFKKLFKIDYNLNLSDENWKSIDKIFEGSVMERLKSNFFQLRDQRLLMTIGNALQTNDRVFVQAGAMHREVMKQVLPIYLKSLSDFKPKASIKPIEYLEDDSTTQPYHLKIKIGNKELLLWSAATRDIYADDQLSSELLEFRPSAILIEDFPEHYSTKLENVKFAGEPGLLRYLGAQNELPVYNWAEQNSASFYQLLKKYNREDLITTITFHYLSKYHRVYRNFGNYDNFWGVLSIRLLCANTMLTDYESSIGRFSERAVDHGILSEDSAHHVNIDFDKLRLALKSTKILPINKDLELLKANELLNSVVKNLKYNDRVFVHAPHQYIKALERSLPLIKDYLKQ